jgi:2-C-methyl-D-erythritol 4-phosphate cytidylyltransferase/2-C-methyl-D-erythritol 2,4-cyclodiphosphate synthase
MTIAAIILAAGRGTRAGGDLPKQWQNLCGRPVLAHALDAFARFHRVLVIHPDDLSLVSQLDLGGVQIVIGADSRDGSVRAGLQALDATRFNRVLIHDGARPLALDAVINGVLAGLDHSPAAAPGLALTDAIWTGVQGQVTGLRDRSGLFRAQTPQGFHLGAIIAAHAAHQGPAADDVEVARAAGLAVRITPGDEDNIKITWPGDLDRAARIMGRTRMDIRTGNGFDVHAFTAGDGCWLCGVKVPHDRALLGHSDADVGIHALTDAIYGALAEGDIGRHFPPSDPQWKGAESHAFLTHAAGRAAARGFVLTHCDVTLICERPKIGPHAGAMQARLAQILGITPDRVSVKATTSERLGFTGREEGIAAMATATLVAK